MPLTDLNLPSGSTSGTQVLSDLKTRDEFAFKLFDGFTGLTNIPDLAKQLETTLNNGIRTGAFKYWDSTASQWKDVFIFGNLLHHDSSGKILLQNSPTLIDPKSYLHIRRSALTGGVPGGSYPAESETPLIVETNGKSKIFLIGDQASDQTFQFGNQATGESFRQIWNHDADLFRLLWSSGSVIGMKGGRLGIGSDLTGRDGGLVVLNGVGSTDGAIFVNGSSYPFKLFTGPNEDVRFEPGKGNGAMVINEHGQTCVIGNGAITSGWNFDVWANGASRFRIKEDQIFAGVDIDMNGKKILNGAAATTGTGFVIKDQMDTADTALQAQITQNATDITTNGLAISDNTSEISTNSGRLDALETAQTDDQVKFHETFSNVGQLQIDFQQSFKAFTFKAIFKDLDPPVGVDGPRLSFIDQRGVGVTPSLGEGNFMNHYHNTNHLSERWISKGNGSEMVYTFSTNHHYMITGKVYVYDGRIMANCKCSAISPDGSLSGISYGSTTLNLSTSPPVAVTGISAINIRCPYSNVSGEMIAYAQE